MKHVTWVAMVLGVWLMASPFAFGYSPSRPCAVTEDLLPGIVLLATSGWILWAKVLPLRAEWLQTLCGLWLIFGSFVLLFSRVPRGSLNDLIVGILVLIVSLVATSPLARQLGSTE
jgi:hypothetical protein